MLKNLNEKSFLSFTGFLGYHFEIVVYYPKFSDLAFTPLISSFNLISFLRIVQFSRYKTADKVDCGGPGRTRTSDLTLIRRAL